VDRGGGIGCTRPYDRRRVYRVQAEGRVGLCRREMVGVRVLLGCHCHDGVAEDNPHRIRRHRSHRIERGADGVVAAAAKAEDREMIHLGEEGWLCEPVAVRIAPRRNHHRNRRPHHPHRRLRLRILGDLDRPNRR